MSRIVVIEVSEDDAVEIAEALYTKANLIASGEYGPEDEPGQNKRWVEDLVRIQDAVENAPVEERR